MYSLRSSLHKTLLIGAFFLISLFVFTITAPTARAATIPVQGYAWSSFLGWLHFNGSNYGVYKDTTTGALSGYAWSPYYGYVTFNAADVIGCPSGTCAPAVNLSTGAVTGWARSCAAFANKSACSGTLDAGTGGWDGWIHLSGASYGVTSTAGCWSGYAWGSQNIGYIHFSGSSYQVGDTTCGALPDLTAYAITPTSTTVGSSTVLRSIYENLSTTTATATGFTLLFQKATDASGTGAADIGTYVRSGNGLGAGTKSTASLTYTFPASEAGTTSYIRACADKSSATDTGTIAESNETNNCGPWTAVAVAAAPAALSVSCAGTPSTGTTGTTQFTWTATVSGGTSPYTYSWSGTDSLTGTTATVQKTYSTSGTKSASVTVTDSLGVSSGSIACTVAGGGGGGTSVTVSNPTPTATLTASPNPQDTGLSSTLTWSSTNATSCVNSAGNGAGGFTTGGAVSGNVSTGALTVNPTNYSVTCTGAGGSATANVSITVNQPGVTISASPERVTSGGSTNISWTTSQIASCSSLTRNGVVWLTNPSPSDTTAHTATNITTQTTFTLTCTSNAGSTRTDSVTVNVGPDFTEF